MQSSFALCSFSLCVLVDTKIGRNFGELLITDSDESELYVLNSRTLYHFIFGNQMEKDFQTVTYM